MAKLKYDVVATVGQYEKDGQTKYISRKVGAVIQTDKGFRLKMDAFFNPAGCRIEADGSIWLAFFEPRETQPQAWQQTPRNASAPQPAQQAAPRDNFDDDIPFAPAHYLSGM